MTRSRTMGAALAAAMLVMGAGRLAAQERVEIHRGRDARGWLGISFRAEKVNDKETMVVDRVLPGSPAQRAGVAAGDTVVAVNGRNPDDAVTGLHTALHPGDTVRLRVRHGGSLAERTVVAAARPGGDVAITNEVIRISGDSTHEPVIIRLDSLGAIADRGVRRMLDSLGIEMRGLSRMSEGQAREIHVMVDSARGAGRMIRIHVDSMRRDLDSLVYRIDTLRSHLRRMHGAPQIEDNDVEVDVRDGEQRTHLMIRRDSMGPGQRMRVPFYLDVGRRALGGAEMVDLDEKLGAYFSTRQGALVVAVAPRTPAARAGLEPGDVVVRAGDRAVASVADLRQAAMGADRGSIRLQVLRHGRRRDLEMPWDRATGVYEESGMRRRVETRRVVKHDL